MRKSPAQRDFQMNRYILILILFCYHGLSMATISMTLEPNHVQLGETFCLTLTNDDIQSSGIPDLIPLEQNFTIVGTEHSMSYTAVNGQAKSLSQWRILLMAKTTGVILIPAIKMGQQQSQPGQIKITGHGQTNPVDNSMDLSVSADEVSLSTDVSLSSPFINEQIIYTVKLYNSQRLLEAAYQPPQIDDALLIPLGDGRHYQTTKNGQNYAVEEQQYAIFPQKSGEITIKPPLFTALVYDAIPRRINVQGKETTLSIKPVPTDSLGENWLPAKQVTLTEHYDHTEFTMAKGSTVERTVTLQAIAVPAQLLPAIAFPDSKQYSVYAEKPATHNVLKNQTLVGTTAVKVTYVLNKSGRVTLPPIRLKWFNTVSGNTEVASLPERTMTVEATKSVNEAANRASQQPDAAAQQSSVAKGDVHNNYQMIAWIAVGLALAWALTLFLWWRRGYQTVSPRFSNGLILKRIKDACANNNPVQARDAILCWAKLHWPNTALLSINDFIKFTHPSALEKQLHLLSLTLYRQDASVVWRGEDLWQSILAFKPIKTSKKIKLDNLPPINPLC